MKFLLEPLGDLDYRVTAGSESFSLRQHLGFSDDVHGDVEHHPAWQAFWEITASDLEKERADFEIEYLKYMAHCRHYAKLVLRGLGEKVTVSAVEDQVVLTFSKDTVDHDRQEHARLAFLAYVRTHGIKFIDTEHHKEAERSFSASMYMYLNGRAASTSVYFEDAALRRNELKNHADRASAVAKGSDARGYALSNRVNLLGPKAFNRGPIQLDRPIGEADSPPSLVVSNPAMALGLNPGRRTR